MAGICSTDLELVKGYLPFSGVLGHEFVGVVTAVGSPHTDFDWIGQRVVGTISLGCGRCAVCLSDGQGHCLRARCWASTARMASSPITSPCPSPICCPCPTVTDEQAVFTEPLAAALRIREQVNMRPDDAYSCVRPRPVGAAGGQVLALGGGQVTMLGRSRASLELPARLGLQTGLAADFEDNSFDFVVEATGNAAGFAQSLRLVRPRGTLVLKSTFAGDATLNLTKLVVAEINVIGSRCGPFAPALRLLARREVDVLASVNGRYPLHQAPAALDHAARPGIRKILIQCRR
jgi:threonine dehydrogenase-like Zn-dependent dehydrogenase